MAKKRSNTKTWHWHGCKRCHARFGDNCATPNQSPVCRTCEVGAPRWELLYENALPKDCCIETSVLLGTKTKDEKAHLKKYDLTTACPWYQCQICRRTHPYDDPKKIKRENWDGKAG